MNMDTLPARHRRVPALAAVIFLSCIFLSCTLTRAQTDSSGDRDLRAAIDRIARQTLESTGVPSASIAVVKDGQIVYVQAYGNARLEPRVLARPEMRYSLGSVSKQFTATAILMLADQHKLSLDDRVSRFLPSLTRAKEVTIRQLLSHTSGYQDYWPQDYVPPFMLKDVTAEQILDRWARIKLDFDPGTKWQYSNTNFVIAGVIVEKAGGASLFHFLAEHVLRPLGMESVADVDKGALADPDATGYLRYGLGPPRVAPKEAKGWLFAAAELGMSAEDLAKWDLGMINQRLLLPSSYKEMQTEVRLKNGMGTQYGLGIAIKDEGGHRALEHGGEVSGFSTRNVIFPDDRAAVAVLTNQDSAAAAGIIAGKIAPLLFHDEQVIAKRQLQAREIFERLQAGAIDRSLFTANANSYFTEQALQDFAAGLSSLGPAVEFLQTGREDRGGMIYRSYKAKFSQKTLDIWIREMPDGKIEQYQVMVAP
jgi:D-alanyl-D-alanine carboxypeptidase